MFWIFTDEYCFVGFFTQLLYILTPIAFVVQLKNKVLNFDRVSIFGLLSLYCNSFLYFWRSIYKRTTSDIDPLDYCNLAGAYLGFIYLIIYLYYIYFTTNKKKGLIFMGILSASSVIVWLIISLTVKENNIWDRIFGWLGVIFNVTEYFPLGFNLIYLIKNKISEKYLLFGALSGFINCVAWLAWAIHAVVDSGDPLEYSIVANCLGICLVSTQAILFFIFKKPDSDDIADNEEKTNDIIEDGYDIVKENEENKEPEYITDFI